MLVIFICMNYKKIHDKIVERAKLRELKGYSEKHHIIPKCMGGTDEKDNLVKLTAKEHWLIHLLLIEIYPKNNKLKIAMKLMMGKSCNHDRIKITSGKQFDRLRKMIAKAHGELMKGKKRASFSETHKKNISKSKKGKPSNRKGVKLSNETKEKIGRASIGRIDGDKNPMKDLKQKKRMEEFNPMHNDFVLENFIGSKNPNAKKVKILKTNEEFLTINDCINKLSISRSKFYKMVKNKEIIYI